MSISLETVEINGVKYVRADQVAQLAPPSGNRAVVVLDRGWIVAGDVTRRDDRIYLSRSVHVRSWQSIGFDGMITNPKSDKVQLRGLPEGFECPKDSEIFCQRVNDNWGL
jgi:hypothetical protein